MKDSGSVHVACVDTGDTSAAIVGLEARAEPPKPAEALVVRLIHPDRQAAEVLRLFEGARWSDPAAALAAWKQAASGSSPLGKPAEAIIALLNPEMTSEWRALDGAEVRIAFDATTGRLGWFALIPSDDGTLAAGITASRLTNPDDRPIAVEGRELPVARLGKSGTPLACQVGTTVVVAGSRDGLERGAGLARADRGTVSGPKLDSGTVFRLEMGRIDIPPNASLGTASNASRRSTPSAAAGWTGPLRLQGGTVVVDMTTTLERARQVHPDHRHPGVARTWLEGLPSAGVMALISLAIDPEPSSWDWAFAVADRIERADPARAGLAPLRSRLNLLLAAAGLKLEADIHPHLRGISACLYRRAGPAGAGRRDTGRPSLRRSIHRRSPGPRGAARLGALLGANAAGRGRHHPASGLRCLERLG